MWFIVSSLLSALCSFVLLSPHYVLEQKLLQELKTDTGVASLFFSALISQCEVNFKPHSVHSVIAVSSLSHPPFD